MMMSGRECCLMVLNHLRKDEMIGLDLCDLLVDRTVPQGIEHCAAQLEMAYEDYLNGYDDAWEDWAIFTTECQV